MTNTHTQVKRPVSSKDKAEENGRTDGWTLLIGWEKCLENDLFSVE